MKIDIEHKSPLRRWNVCEDCANGSMNILENYLSSNITKVKDTFIDEYWYMISKKAVRLVGFRRKIKLVYRIRFLSWERRSKVTICKICKQPSRCLSEVQRVASS